MSTKYRKIDISVVAIVHYAEGAEPGNEYMALAEGWSGYGASEDAAIRDLTAKIAAHTAYRLAHAE